jgi:hypothetical protein
MRRTRAAVIPTGGTVAVTLEVIEGTDTGANTYQYLSILEKRDADWRVVAAQSTRELALTPRVSAQVAGRSPTTPAATAAGAAACCASWRGTRCSR